MLHLMFVSGIVLMPLSAYAIFKIGKAKDNPNYKKANIAAWLSLLLGAVFVIIPRSIWKVDDVKKQNTDNSISWNAKVSNSVQGSVDEKVLKQIIAKFSELYTPVLKRYSGCIKTATVEITQHNPNQKSPLYRQEEYGWFTELQICIEIKDDMTVKIGKYLLTGQNLWYFIGSGTNPGIEALKAESAVFIGIDDSKIIPGEHTFTSIPEYKLIDMLIMQE